MIEPTEEGRKLAADLANAEREALGFSGDLYKSTNFANPYNTSSYALARLATRFLTMEADMAEIYRLVDGLNWQGAIPAIRTLAAKYRKPKPDPLVEALNEAWGKSLGVFLPQAGDVLRAELAKRGIELKERGE